MEVDIEEGENEPELTYPYEEMDPFNPLLTASELELKDAIEVENPIKHEDETVPASVYEVGESSTAPLLHEDSDGLLPGLMRRDINSLFGRMASLSRRLCGRKTAHALVEKKGKAKDEFYEGKKVRFAAVTLQGHALTWWNSKTALMGLETVNQMPWTEIKQLMTRFNELALMCPRMVEPEKVKVDAYIRGLTDNIKGEVTSSKLANLSEAALMAHKLMDQKSQARNERIFKGKKRKWESFQSGNSSGNGNQRDNSRQPLQNNQRHKIKYCKEKNVATGADALLIPTCYDCGEQGHTRNQC
nr:hypothetical protein [Tanacetum cinerariifolium]